MKRTGTILCIMMLVCVALIVARTGKAQPLPQIAILPDEYFTSNEVETVIGTNFYNNSVVRIDLLLPNGQTVEGVASANTDTYGNFSTQFTAPDQNGNGYVKAVCKDQIISRIVYFIGSSSPEVLNVTVSPSTLYTNITSHITVIAPSLVDRNWILIITTVTPSNRDITMYEVLHVGKYEFDYLFGEKGVWLLNVSVEGTPYVNKQYLEVLEGNIPPPILNITWDIQHTGNRYSISIYDTGLLIRNGTVKVTYPNNAIDVIPIPADGVVVFTANITGKYRLSYVNQGREYKSDFTYIPQILINATQFDDNGKTTITVSIDGTPAPDTVTVSVSGAETGIVTLSGGTGEYTARTIGSYTFTVTYAGTQKTISIAYTETYSINDFMAVQSGDYIVITGTVIGDKSHKGVSGVTVQIQCPDQEYADTLTSGSDGTFSGQIPLKNKGSYFSGKSVAVKYIAGGKTQTVNVKVTPDFWGDWLWLVVIVAGLFLFALWWSGRLSQWSGNRIPPPKRLAFGGKGEEDMEDMGMGW